MNANQDSGKYLSLDQVVKSENIALPSVAKHLATKRIILRSNAKFKILAIKKIAILINTIIPPIQDAIHAQSQIVTFALLIQNNV